LKINRLVKKLRVHLLSREKEVGWSTRCKEKFASAFNALTKGQWDCSHKWPRCLIQYKISDKSRAYLRKGLLIRVRRVHVGHGMPWIGILWGMHVHGHRSCMGRTERSHQRRIWRPVTHRVYWWSPRSLHVLLRDGWGPWGFHVRLWPWCNSQLRKLCVIVHQGGIQGLHSIWSQTHTKTRIKALSIPVAGQTSQTTVQLEKHNWCTSAILQYLEDSRTPLSPSKWALVPQRFLPLPPTSSSKYASTPSNANHAQNGHNWPSNVLQTLKVGRIYEQLT